MVSVLVYVLEVRSREVTISKRQERRSKTQKLIRQRQQKSGNIASLLKQEARITELEEAISKAADMLWDMAQEFNRKAPLDLSEELRKLLPSSE